MRAFASTLSAFCSGHAALPELLNALRNDLARDRQTLLKNRVLIDEAWRSGHVGDAAYRALRDTISGFDFKASGASFPPQSPTVPPNAAERAASVSIDHDAPTKAHPSVHQQSIRAAEHSSRAQAPSISHRNHSSAHAVWPAAAPAFLRSRHLDSCPAEELTVDVCAGTVLKERFVLEEEIGRGGMGTVFKARDARKEEAQDRDPYVAVKVLNEDIRRHPTYFKALQREAKKSQSLGHPNIAAVFDFDRDGSTVFLVMELLKGSSLRALIDDRGRRGLPQAEALRIIGAAGTALAYAHSKGVIHSDFKPANVIRLHDGTIKVLDFGIARAFSPVQAEVPVTYFDVASLRALTPAYASPEMLLGEPPDPRDDVFALGCVAYELLTGRHPFGYAASLSAERSGTKVVPIKRLRRNTWRAIQRALAFSRAERTPSVEEFLQELEPGKVRISLRGPGLAAAAAIVIAAGIYFVEMQPATPDRTVVENVEPEPIAALPADPQPASVEQSASEPRVASADVDVDRSVRVEARPARAQPPAAAASQATSERTERVSEPQGHPLEGLSTLQLKDRVVALARVDEVPDALTALNVFEASASAGDPGIREAKIAIAQAYARLAERAFAAGDYSSATALGTRATEMAPALEIHQERLRQMQRVTQLAEALETSEPLPVERIRAELAKIRASEGPNYYLARNQLANVLLDRIQDLRVRAPNRARAMTDQAHELFAGVPAIDSLQ